MIYPETSGSRRTNNATEVDVSETHFIDRLKVSDAIYYYH
jgi:hypothetical protein